MTLCVAAACREEDQPRIVLCADRRVETWAASAEIGFKFEWVKSKWPVLYAGDLSQAKNTIQTFFQCLAPVQLTSINIQDEFQKPSQKQKRKLAEQYVQSQLGISYEEFLATGKERLPEDIFREMVSSIRRIKLGCELLIAGFLVEGQQYAPYLFVMDDSGDVKLEEHFAAIGSGMTIAEPALFQRQHRRFTSLGEAIYHVYEAHRLARIAPGVGEQFDLVIIAPPSSPTESLRLLALTIQGESQLKRLYKKYGPKKIPSITPADDWLMSPM